MRKSLYTLLLLIFSVTLYADGPESAPKRDHQIHLSKPAKEIKLMLYDKSFLPVQGILSEDRKSIIIKNYVKGSRVRVKVEYEDGTVDEFVKSPCFIDPVVT